MSDQTTENTPVPANSGDDSNTTTVETKPAKAPKAPKAAGVGTAKGMAFLSLLLVCGAGYYGYTELNKFKASLAAQEEALADIGKHKTFVTFKQQLSARLDKFQDEYHTSQKHIKELEALVTETASAAARDQEGWTLAETEYLMNIANARLRLLRDVNAAKEALKGADQRLASLNNPSFLPVRETLAKEITALEMVGTPDIYGVVLRLSQLNDWVSRLPPAKVAMNEHDIEKHEEELGEFSYFGQLGRWFREDFFGATKKGTPYFSLDKNKEVFYIDQLIKLEVEAAKHAALRFDQSAYQTHLAKAFEIVDEKYDAQSQKVSQVLKTLHELRAEVVFPELPNISKSSLQLKRIRSEYRGEQGGGA